MGVGQGGQFAGDDGAGRGLQGDDDVDGDVQAGGPAGAAGASGSVGGAGDVGIEDWGAGVGGRAPLTNDDPADREKLHDDTEPNNGT